MGFGNLIDASAQNALTGMQQSTNAIGAGMQLTSANQQASALQGEANNAFVSATANAEQAQLAGDTAVGKQKQAYANAGVEQTGSVLDTLNQTRMLTEQQVSMLEQQGTLQQNMYNSQANITQQEGLMQVLGAEGQNQISGEQNQINQFEQTSQLIMSFLGMGTGFGGGIIDSLIAKK